MVQTKTLPIPIDFGFIHRCEVFLLFKILRRYTTMPLRNQSNNHTPNVPRHGPRKKEHNIDVEILNRLVSKSLDVLFLHFTLSKVHATLSVPHSNPLS